MTPTRFKTNGRWWFWISLTFFVVPWFLPIWDIKGDTLMPAAIWIILFTHLDHFIETLMGICLFSLLFGCSCHFHRMDCPVYCRDDSKHNPTEEGTCRLTIPRSRPTTMPALPLHDQRQWPAAAQVMIGGPQRAP